MRFDVFDVSRVYHGTGQYTAFDCINLALSKSCAISSIHKTFVHSIFQIFESRDTSDQRFV